MSSLASLVVAVLAVRCAERQVDGARAQLEGARALRREQAQPYVVVHAETDRSRPDVIDVLRLTAVVRISG